MERLEAGVSTLEFRKKRKREDAGDCGRRGGRVARERKGEEEKTNCHSKSAKKREEEVDQHQERITDPESKKNSVTVGSGGVHPDKRKETPRRFHNTKRKKINRRIFGRTIKKRGGNSIAFKMAVAYGCQGQKKKRRKRTFKKKEERQGDPKSKRGGRSTSESEKLPSG